MRTIKELLEILLDQYKNNRIYSIQKLGICWAISKLLDEGIISGEEYDILSEYIYSNRPEYAWIGYWWLEGDVPPRIKFLKKLIKNYEQ